MVLPISVIVPCYKQEQWLGRAIESALSAGASEVRIFIDSPDKKPGYDVFKQFNSSQLYIAGEQFSFRSGVCFARNFLIARARNEWLLCLDADDRLYPETLSELLGLWKPETWIYPGQFVEIDETGRALEHKQNPLPAMIYRKNLCYSTFLSHRDDWLKTGGFNPQFEVYDEDYAYQCNLVHSGIKAVRAQNANYERMIHENSRSSQARPHWNECLALCKRLYPNAF